MLLRRSTLVYMFRKKIYIYFVLNRVLQVWNYITLGLGCLTFISSSWEHLDSLMWTILGSCRPLTANHIYELLRQNLSTSRLFNHIATSRAASSSWWIAFLRFMVSVNGLVPVRHLTKTFASGKTEKMVYQVELFKMITMIMMVLWMINTKEMLWW